MNAFIEWLKQARYDLDTAKALFKTGRYSYCVFMCHLSIEKALKAHYAQKLKTTPPKTHDLNYLCSKIEMDLPQEKLNFIDELNDLSVPTRYPDELQKILREYTKARTQNILNQSTKLLTWLSKNKKK